MSQTPVVSAKILRKHLKPILSRSHPIEAIYVYGSAVRAIEAARKMESDNSRLLARSRPPSRMEGHNDIDVLIIVNDIKPLAEARLKSIEKVCISIREKSKKAGLSFHFQPIKLLSRWWHTLIEGEPWIISSLKNPIIVHDRKGILKEVCRFIEKEHIYNRGEKAERLLERSDSTALQNRRLLLGTISNLSNAGTEAAQILLLFDGKFMLNKRAIAAELEKSYARTLGRGVVDTYTEIVDLEDKIAKGTLSEFSAANLDYYMERLKTFIGKVEGMLGKK